MTDDLDALLLALPPEIVARLEALPPERELIEVVMDLGRRPEARLGGGGEEVLLEREVSEEDLQYVVDHIGSFGEDNRAGIERTLHRISAIRNRSGKIVGLTCRIGRAVFGTIEIIEDLVESGRSVLIMGRPGVGKTTMLREAARVLADEMRKRVVVVDTSNEIAGDGDIPHPGIGRARRMQVRTPELQHGVMIEAVENHMPEVIVIDEIGTELEAIAARTIAERGVQLIGTAHGNSLDNLMLNPTLSDLIGGIQSVTLGDEEARRRRSQKSVLERKAPPTFDVVVEIQDRERVMVHGDVAETVDALLRGDPLAPELRWRDEGGVHRSQPRPRPGPAAQLPGERFGGLVGTGPGWRTEPGWRPGLRRSDVAPELERGTRPGYRPGAGGGWRGARGRSGGAGRSRSADQGGSRSGGEPWPPGPSVAPGSVGSIASGAFRAGEIADRGPVERGSLSVVDARARESRELERQRLWRESATRAIQGLRAEEGREAVLDEPDEDDPVTSTGPASHPAAISSSAAESIRAAGPTGDVEAEHPDRASGGPGPASRETDHEASIQAAMTVSDVSSQTLRPGPWSEDGPSESERESDPDEAPIPFDVIAAERGVSTLPVLRVLGFGVSRKKLEQAVRSLQLPVVIVRDVDEAEVVITLRTHYRQKAPVLREAEERGLPVFVLKANTLVQMEACLTSLYAMEVDPDEAALREVEEAIGLVRAAEKPIELSPQNASIRRMQHQAAERANLLSRSRGREPFRRVRVYPDAVRAWR